MSSNYSKTYKFINRRKVLESIRTTSTETPASARANDGLGRSGDKQATERSHQQHRTKSPTNQPYAS